MNDVRDSVRDYIRGELGWTGPAERLADDSSLIDGGVLDSLALLAVAAFLEREYHIDVDEIDLTSDNFETLNRIATYVESRRVGTVQ